ncbi:MAG: sulfatase [Kiritimatiellae bacterium]|nr:sulfatase [Kiritimatiellia bacterium]
MSRSVGRRNFLKVAGLGITAGLCPPAVFAAGDAAGADKRPNIVWLVSEDNSPHYMDLYHPGGAETPNIRALAKKGVVFNHAFSNSPVCSAARSTLITGSYGARIGTNYHRGRGRARLPEGLEPLSASLQNAGYYTSYLTKSDFNFHGWEVSWDSDTDWSGRREGQPFFHQHLFMVTHESELHRRWQEGSDDQDTPLPSYFPNTETFRRTINAYRDMHREMDRELGEVMAQLEAEGVLEDTFIFYFGDHGGVLPRSKGYLYEKGLQVPLVVRIPENFKHLVGYRPGTRADGFVSFIDFAPTMLALAGLEVPALMDGKPFLGPGIDVKEVEARDETFGMADRFDQKYDLVRTLRRGNWKYMRSYQPFNFDGLNNSFRYRLTAYREWRELFDQGKLNGVQRQFFEPRAPEALYDLENDPDETVNLAADPQHAETLNVLRNRLTEWVKGMPDLLFYPESYLVAHDAFDDPVGFGLMRREHIAKLVEIADLQLLPFDAAKEALEQALVSDHPVERYWGLIVCSAFGEEAAGFYDRAKEMAESDPSPLNRGRAAEFLGLTGAADPVPLIHAALAACEDPWEALLILNTAVMLTEGKPGYTFHLTGESIPVHNFLTRRRLSFFRVEN